MTHRSRLTSVLVDVPAADADAEIAFWSAALGHEPKRFDTHPEYTGLGTPTPGMIFMVQATGDETPRAHFDIETDDVEAEVARLTALGAAEVARHGTWVVMRDPAGLIFCVVRVQLQDAFDAHATSWD